MARVCLYKDISLFPLVITSNTEDVDLSSCRAKLKDNGDQLDNMINLKVITSAEM